MIKIYRQKETHKKISLFHGMSFIEKFVMVMGPILITYIVYNILQFTEYVWWIRLGMSVGVTTILWIFIYLFAILMTKLDWY